MQITDEQIKIIRAACDIIEDAVTESNDVSRTKEIFAALDRIDEIVGKA